MKGNVVNVSMTGVIGLFALSSLVTCGTNQADEETIIIKSDVVGKQSEAQEHVQEELKENENINLRLVKFTDYRQLTVTLEDGSIDLHTALTEIFMDNVNEESGYSNTTITYMTSNPLGICSDKITDISESADGATVASPNDVLDESRALLLLQIAGLITLDESKGLLPTTSDVTENPKVLRFELLDSNQTVRAMAGVDISLINNGMAVDADLVLTEDAVFLESVADSSMPYYDVIATQADETENNVYQTVVAYYQTDEVRAIINEVIKKLSIPVWE